MSDHKEPKAGEMRNTTSGCDIFNGKEWVSCSALSVEEYSMAVFDKLNAPEAKKKTITVENPPAFPQSELDRVLYVHGGMTLRDYFAAAAMNAGLNHYGLSNGNEGAEARNAYRMADEMLKARKS